MRDNSSKNISVIIVVAVALVMTVVVLFGFYGIDQQEQESPIEFVVVYEDNSTEVLTDGDSKTFGAEEQSDGTMAIYKSSNKNNEVSSFHVKAHVTVDGEHIDADRVRVTGELTIDSDFRSSERNIEIDKKCSVGERTNLYNYCTSVSTSQALNEQGANEINSNLSLNASTDGVSASDSASGTLTLYSGVTSNLTAEVEVDANAI